MEDRRTKPRWREVRHQIESGDRPHHVANYVLRRMNIQHPPVPVESIAKHLDVELIRDPRLDVAGVLQSTRESAIITVNSSDPPVRQRFTVAHELGHLLLHTIGIQFRDTFFGTTGDWKESQANEFAASLLMPLWMLEPIVGRKRLTGKKLADMFEVSSAALNVQLKKLV